MACLRASLGSREKPIAADPIQKTAPDLMMSSLRQDSVQPRIKTAFIFLLEFQGVLSATAKVPKMRELQGFPAATPPLSQQQRIARIPPCSIFEDRDGIRPDGSPTSLSPPVGCSRTDLDQACGSGPAGFAIAFSPVRLGGFRKNRRTSHDSSVEPKLALVEQQSNTKE
jgi:hypothetical protein